MTEIEILEQEIAQKREQLKQLKEKQKPHFHFECLDAYFDKYKFEYIVTEKLKNHMRSMMKTMTTAQSRMNYTKKECLHTSLIQPKMDEIGAEKIAICNEFIKEITPIVGKYMEKFIEMNRGKKLC